MTKFYLCSEIREFPYLTEALQGVKKTQFMTSTMIVGSQIMLVMESDNITLKVTEFVSLRGNIG